jgi:SAM-dependent methyltransferase
MPCRLCGFKEKQSLIADNVFGGKKEHKFWRCGSCGVIYLYPYLSDKEEKYFYEKEFEKFMSSRAADHRDWSNVKKHVQTNQDQVKRRWQYLAEHLHKDKSILEIGCSSGFMLEAFRKKGLNCCGVEPSGVFLEFLHDNNFEAYKSLEELKKKTEKTFDLIVHFFVFEHISDPLKFLKETYALLNNDGIIIAEIPSSTDVLTSIYNIPEFEKFYWSIAHHYYFNPQSIEYIMKKLGYEYEILPEQRYDLSNHITWMMDGKPGGQARFKFFSNKTLDFYKKDLKENWKCDTLILKIFKN